MKKKATKLQLNKETVRNLTSDDLKKVAGGSSSECTVPRSCCYTCNQICSCAC